MPVFGADPDSPVKDWEDQPVVRQPRTSKEVGRLVHYFGYHKMLRMSQRFNADDRAIIARYCSTKLANGLSPDSIMEIIDRFYSSPHNSTNFPALMFSKREVQDELVRDIRIDSDDEVLQWLSDGMPNSGPFDEPREMRKALLLYSNEGLHRYPEVVADILRLDYSPSKTASLIESLEQLVMWILRETDDPGDTDDLKRYVRLPSELESRHRVSPNRLRKRSETVNAAVSNIPKSRRSR